VKGSERDTICIPELEELAEQRQSASSAYPREVDAALLKYGPLVRTSALTWDKITAALNAKFDLDKSPEAYASHHKRIKRKT